MKIKITLITLLTCFTFYAQNFKEIQLPSPDKVNESYIGPLFKSTIHYGATPSNYNGEVIIFTHGYLDLNQLQFLIDNSFYKDAYDAGYQVAFVATTRGGGVWKNGRLFAKSIDMITRKYNVPAVDLIVHSNGGRSSEVAMYEYGKKNKVKQVFALGTPFWGTEIADFSQLPFLNWIWRLTGQNEGARTSTTYYCRDVYRPYFDNNSENEPEKFISLGASAYYNGSNRLVKAVLKITGSIIKYRGGGVNDGIAPYYSTLRDGATIVFEKNDPRAMVDHVDISTGQFSWPYIKPFLDNRALANKTATKSIPSKKEDRIIESNSYILYSQNNSDRIILDKNSNFAIAEIIHENPIANFTIKDEFGNIVNGQKKYQSQHHKTTIPFSESNRILTSDSKFAAIIKQQNGVTMSLAHQKKESHQILKVDFSNQKKENISSKNIDVRAIMTRTSTISGKVIDEEPQVVSFTQKNNSFFFDTKNLEDGVYNLLITGESAQNFKRNIISGFVVGDIQKGLASIDTYDISKPIERRIHIYPNSVKDNAHLTLRGYPTIDQLSIKIYDITGKEVKRFNTMTNLTTQVNISEQLRVLSSGLYILQVNNDQTVKFIKD